MLSSFPIFCCLSVWAAVCVVALEAMIVTKLLCVPLFAAAAVFVQLCKGFVPSNSLKTELCCSDRQRRPLPTFCAVCFLYGAYVFTVTCSNHWVVVNFTLSYLCLMPHCTACNNTSTCVIEIAGETWWPSLGSAAQRSSWSGPCMLCW